MSEVNIGSCRGVELCLSWRPASNGIIPEGTQAVDAGNKCYVARAKHNGKWTPGKQPGGHKTAYISYGGQVYPYEKYEVLVHSDVDCYGQGYSWIRASGGTGLPDRALVAGTDDVAPLFVARCLKDGEVCTGKLKLGDSKAHFPWGGVEHSTDSYDILFFTSSYSQQ